MATATSPSDAALAHSRPGEPPDRWHRLHEHLAEVAKLAAEFAEVFDGGEWATVLGIWHDLGKYDPDFQSYLRRVGGADGHLEAENEVLRATRGPEHSIAGALLAIERFRPGVWRCLAFSIAGHHAGLPDWVDKGSLQGRLERARQRDMLGRARQGRVPPEILDAPMPTSGPRNLSAESLAFWIRMLFSALVDADFLDTERFMAPARADERPSWPPLAELSETLDRRLDAKTIAAAPSEVNRARAEILTSCRAKASLSPGLFTLTVPTGGGKTLASLAFALRHAGVHDLRRVVYAIPYTSIIEQTADIFRGVFDDLGEVVV